MGASRIVWGAAMAVCVAAVGYAQTHPASGPARSTSFDAGAMEAIVKQLGDPSFAEREAGQRLLEQVPLSQRDVLAAIAQTTNDAEIKARLTQRVDHMDEQIAIDPPPISVDLRDASAADVAAALSRATGKDITPPAFDQDRFTLKAVDEPYWEVMRQLAAQHPLWPVNGSNLTQRTFAQIQILRGVAIAAGKPTLRPGAAQTVVSLSLNVSLDPRIHVISLDLPMVAAAQDDQGRPLVNITGGMGMNNLGNGGFGGNPGFGNGGLGNPNPVHFLSQTITFMSTQSAIKTVSLKGTINVMMEVGFQSDMVADPADPGKPPKFRLAPPTRTGKVEVPFEFKDIPIGP